MAEAELGGEMSEWSKEHAWKVCVPYQGTEGSNPSLSEAFLLRWHLSPVELGAFRWGDTQLRQGRKAAAVSIFFMWKDYLFLRELNVTLLFASVLLGDFFQKLKGPFYRPGRKK